MQQLLELYSKWSGSSAASVERLPIAGSNREYYRISADGGDSVIGVVGTSLDENHAFIYLTRHFSGKGLPVPNILAVSDDEMRYLQTDLGHTSLFDAISAGRTSGGDYDSHERELLSRTVRLLPKMQVLGAQGLDFSQCYPQSEFDTDTVSFDLNYFKYCFLKPVGLDFHEVRLEADFRAFAAALTSEASDTFLYRDFQSRNVMIDADGSPHFIDYQGGRRGPVYYDLASFLWQASARIPDELRQSLIADYYHELQSYIPDVPSLEAFRERLYQFVLFRTLQVLGAYGFRGYFERKQHFLASIPPAIANLRQLLSLNCYPYPYMMDMLRRLTEMPRFALDSALPTANAKTNEQSATKTTDTSGPLVVRVYSFSYRKGIPEDTSGNGGGYVFDCRSTHNPGRYQPYKQLTGLDAPVIRFLEDDGEITTFLESVYKLADAHVSRYIERGFTSLMFCFGCTGGQHRSVYSAQHLAEHIHDTFGIEVHIIHREQNITQILESR